MKEAINSKRDEQGGSVGAALQAMLTKLRPGPGLVAASEEIELAPWLDRGIVVAVLLACGVALSLNVADPDLWGHVQYGRDALAKGLPLTTTYSYVAEGYPWINHEILAEYALAIGADWFGGAGMLLIKCLLGMAVVGVIFWRALRLESGLIAGCALALLVAITLGSHWSLRPQLMSYVSFALLLVLLSYCFAGWEGKWWLGTNWNGFVNSVSNQLRGAAEAEEGRRLKPAVERTNYDLRYPGLKPGSDGGSRLKPARGRRSLM